MSRAAMSKSRAEKSRTTSVSVSQAVGQTAPPDVVQGRLTEADWVSMVAQEEGEEAVAEVFDVLMARVMEECYRAYLKKQLIPFTVMQARDAMVQIVEWRFLARDKGEESVQCDPTWQEDEEPSPCGTDSWAQGSVPVVHTGLTPRGTGKQKLAEPPTKENTQPTAHQPETDTQQEQSKSRQKEIKDLDLTPNKQTSEIKREKKEPPVPRKTNLPRNPTPPPKEQKAKRQYKPHRGALPSAGLRNFTKPLEDSERDLLIQQLSQSLPSEQDSPKLIPAAFHNLLKIQGSRPAQNNNITYDESGNVTAVRRLEPARLPRHLVRPRVELVDPEVEAEQVRLAAIKAGWGTLRRTIRGKDKSEAQRTREAGARPDWTVTKSTRKQIPLCGLAESQASKSLYKEERQVPHAPLSTMASLLLESMELSPGVVLREPNGARRGSWKGSTQEGRDYQGNVLRPILPNVPRPLISVDQLLEGHNLQVIHTVPRHSLQTPLVGR
ncbi:UNVERIFIED_CONTAM: hypothetical protein FKN15_066099 [Acipenser sinensis]